MIKQTNIILKELEEVIKKINQEKTEKLVNEIINTKSINVIGHGRSGYIGKSFSMRLKHLGLKTGKSLLIIISGSGKTKQIIKQVNKSKKSKVILITMNKNSVLAKKANLIIELKAKKSKQPMRSLFEQTCLIYLDSIIMILMEKLKISEKQMWKRHD